jgi:branched-chain amino acid transport system substrate-binding protein
MMKNSFEMAAEDINGAGGIKGKPVSLIFADDGGKQRAAEQAVEKLKEQGVAMVVGGYSSSNTLYTARAADKNDLPFIVCTAADDRLTRRDLKNVFRLNPPAAEYAGGLEDFLLKEISPKSIAIVYENSPYGTGGAMRMMWFCRENEIEVFRIIPYHRERASFDYFKHIAAPLKSEASAPDVIYMISYLKDGALLLKNIREMKLNALLVGGAGGFTHPDFPERAGEAAELFVTATLWSDGLDYPETKKYLDDYLKKFGKKPDYHGAEAYSALLVAAEALKKAENFEPETVRGALGRTEISTPFGPVKFESYDKYERQNRAPTMVLQIVGKEYVCIWPPELASAKFVRPPAPSGGSE